MKLQLENCWKLRIAIIITRPLRLQTKKAPFFAFFYKIRANTQQVLPVQTGFYRYDE